MPTAQMSLSVTLRDRRTKMLDNTNYYSRREAALQGNGRYLFGFPKEKIEEVFLTTACESLQREPKRMNRA